MPSVKMPCSSKENTSWWKYLFLRLKPPCMFSLSDFLFLHLKCILCVHMCNCVKEKKRRGGGGRRKEWVRHVCEMWREQVLLGFWRALRCISQLCKPSFYPSVSPFRFCSMLLFGTVERIQDLNLNANPS